MKKLRGLCDGGGEDRLSSLPDHLIHHIFSFLSTKDAVATSVLSTRWNYLWTSSSRVNIYDYLLYSTSSRPWDPMVKINFMNFVDRVLALQHAPILKELNLVCDEDYDVSRVNAWISIALRCNVQELILSVPSLHPSFVFPRIIFNCESLTTLDICIPPAFHLKVSKSMCFPNLKHLHLAAVYLCGDHSTQQVFFSFPVLEEFDAFELRLFNITTVEISAPLLKSLRLEHEADKDEIQGHGKMIVDAPSLVSLDFSDTVKCEYSIYHTSSVLDANFSIRSVDCLIELLRGICNVKRLRMIGCTTEALLTFDALHLPTFSSLVDLKVGLPDNALDIGRLINLLHKMPNIESLVFDVPYTYGYYEIGVAPEIIPQCVSSHLKSFQLSHFGASEFELYLVKFFLQNASSLEKMTVISSNKISQDPKRQVEVTKQLLTIPRTSPHCMIDFS